MLADTIGFVKKEYNSGIYTSFAIAYDVLLSDKSDSICIDLYLDENFIRQYFYPYVLYANGIKFLEPSVRKLEKIEDILVKIKL